MCPVVIGIGNRLGFRFCRNQSQPAISAEVRLNPDYSGAPASNALFRTGFRENIVSPFIPSPPGTSLGDYCNERQIRLWLCGLSYLQRLDPRRAREKPQPHDTRFCVLLAARIGHALIFDGRKTLRSDSLLAARACSDLIVFVARKDLADGR